MRPSGVPVILKTVAILVAMGVLVMAGWAIWGRERNGVIIDSYRACADAGNPIQESYPEVCVTEDGRQFVNPDQHLDPPPEQ